MQPDAQPLARSSTLAAGSVLDTLRTLNQAYLDAVVNGDVDRFRQILADDFLCSGPDGVLLDKAAFLERTAAPRSLETLTADDVRIRIIGDVAIIHAATGFRTLDGREGRGRYTDIWAKRGGKWFAIAAHVTRLG
jgi:ketosteroid isomerase-like protein